MSDRLRHASITVDYVAERKRWQIVAHNSCGEVILREYDERASAEIRARAIRLLLRVFGGD